MHSLCRTQEYRSTMCPALAPLLLDILLERSHLERTRIVLVPHKVYRKLLIGNEQEQTVLIFGSTMIHRSALRKPHPAARSVLSLVCIEDALKNVEAVAAIMMVPWVREACAVEHLEHHHAGFGIVM